MITASTPEMVLDGRYEVRDRIGSGATAHVYCAEDLWLGRRVALKVLHHRCADDRVLVERFRREASTAAALRHPNLVSVYDYGEWDGTYYLAMEYVPGRSLKSIVDRDAPLHPAAAIDLTVQVLHAAGFAHRHGIIHRDLKPDNVLVAAGGRLKVIDFGVAQTGPPDITEIGSILGTARYMPPEQAEGRAVTVASDLYSIGIILYELLTGRPPFDGETVVAIALQQITGRPVPPAELNEAVTPTLQAVVMRALETEPARRLPDADAFAAALERARATLSTAVPNRPERVLAGAPS